MHKNIPTSLIAENVVNLSNQIFKLLPYKETGNEHLEEHFNNVIFRVIGLSKIIPSPELITVICWLEAAKIETDFGLYRKAVLDSCSTVRAIQQRLGDSNVRVS